MPSPLRVMLFTESFQTGGTERFILRVARHLDRDRFAPCIGCFSEAGAFRAHVPDDVAVHVFPLRTTQPRLARLTALASLVPALRRLHLDLLVTSHSYINARVGIPAALSGIPLITGRRGKITPNRLADRIAGKLANRLAACVIANSRAAALETIRDQRLAPEKMEVVHNGIPALDRHELPLHRQRVRGQLGLSDRERLFVCLARVSPEKGHDVLVEALALLAKQQLRPMLLMLGGGDIAGVLGNAKRLGVDEQVLAYGETDMPFPFLCAADGFVLPSLTESFPNALLEGMQAGLACVASDVGGVGELIDDGETGLLVPPGEPQALADALARLLRDPDEAARLAEAARRRVEEAFTLDHMIHSLERIFIRVAGVADGG